jgi:2-methylaconitate cis-trans-isomerase PrpF
MKQKLTTVEIAEIYSSAVGPFAISEGIITPIEGENTIRILIPILRKLFIVFFKCTMVNR